MIGSSFVSTDAWRGLLGCFKQTLFFVWAMACSVGAQEIFHEGALKSAENGPPSYLLFEAEVIGAHGGIGSLGRDQLGRLIVTSGQRLLAFDGSSWIHYDQKENAGGELKALIRTELGPEGELYATTDRGIFRVRFEAQSHFSLEGVGGLSAEEASEFSGMLGSCTAGEHVFFYSPNKVARFTPRLNTLEFIKREGVSISHGRGRDGTIVTHGFDDRISQFTENGWVDYFPYEDAHYDKMIQSSADWKGVGQILGTVADGLYETDGKSFTRWQMEDLGEGANSILDLEVFDDEYLAVSIQSFGIALLNRKGEVVQLLSRAQDFRLGKASELVYTGGNMLWARLDQGLACIRFMEPITDYSPLSPVPMVLPVPYRDGDDLYLIASRRLMKTEFFKGGALKEIRLVDTVEEEVVNDCVFKEEGILYGTDSGVFIKRENGADERLLRASRLVSRLLYSPINPDRILALSDDYCHELVREDGRWQYSGRRIESMGFAYEYTTGPTGDYWVELGAGSVGRFWYENGNLLKRVFREGDGLPATWVNIWNFGTEIVFSSAESHEVSTWDAASGSFVIDPALGELLGAKYLGLTRPCVTENGDVWVARESGHEVLRKQNYSGYREDRMALRKMSERLLLQAKRGAEDVVWLRGRRELYRYSLNLENRETELAAPLIPQVESIRRGSIVWDRMNRLDGESLVLPYADNSIEFSLSATRNEIGMGVSHQVRLEGFSGDWEKVGTSSRVLYPNLREGEYLFRARSSFDGETYGPSVVLPFVVEPPFYRTYWAYTFYVVIIVLAVVGSSYYLRRRTLLSNRKLKSQVNERTAELSLANTNLKLMYEKANVASESKSAFLAVISHEMRTPLNAIIGPAQMLSARENDEEKRVFLGMIQKAGANLLEFVEEVLEFAATSGKEKPLEEGEFDLIALVEDLRDSHAIRANQKGVLVDCLIDSVIGRDWIGDAKLIRQIASNFVGNAIKFTDDGKITIKVAAEEQTGNVSWIRISVADTGMGIPESERGRVFDPFHQVDNSLTREHDGAGLGLAICKQLAVRLKGAIGFESEVGVGSTFWLSIPLRLGSLDSGEATRRDGGVPSVELPQCSALLVDDNQSNLVVAKKMLEELNCRVVTASNGKLAVERALSEKFDLILMDLRMPEMNGIEAATRIKAEDTLNVDTPIIALSAFLSDELKEECRRAGIERYLSKPIRAESLSEILSESVAS